MATRKTTEGERTMSHYEEIAASWEMWMDYADPQATMEKAEFDAMTHEDRMEFLIGCFGPEHD